MTKTKGTCPWCGDTEHIIMHGSWWNRCTNCGCIYVVSTNRIDAKGRRELKKDENNGLGTV